MIKGILFIEINKKNKKDYRNTCEAIQRNERQVPYFLPRDKSKQSVLTKAKTDTNATEGRKFAIVMLTTRVKETKQNVLCATTDHQSPVAIEQKKTRDRRLQQ